MYAKRLLAPACCLALLSGCTSVHIHGNDGSISVSQGVGVVNITVPENEAPFLIDARGVGIVKIGTNVTIGYTRQTVAVLDNSCRVVFWIEDEAQARAIAELLRKEIGDICVPSGSTTKEGSK